MYIKYVGPDAGSRFVPVLDQEFQPGVEAEVPDTIGRSLCQQIENWEEVKSSKPAAPAVEVTE